MSAKKPLAAKILRFYKNKISPFLGNHCRYYPSCSTYAIEAIEKYGSLKGGSMAAKRLLTCNQFFPGGFDPVR